MHYESNQSIPAKSMADDIAFVDKLISLKGIVKLLLFFSFQLIVLCFQVGRIPNVNRFVENNTFWAFYSSLLVNVAFNYLIFGFLLLLFFSFYLGKELKTRTKEKIILFTFKFFMLSLIFLVVNMVFLYSMFNLYYQVKIGQHVFFNSFYIFFTIPLLSLAYIWVLFIVLIIVFRVISFFFHLFSRNKIVQSEPVIQTAQNTTKTAHINVDTYKTPEQVNQIETQVSGQRSLTKQEIISMQLQQTENEETKPETVRKPRTPAFLLNLLDKNLFKYSLLEQSIFFFSITEFLFLLFFFVEASPYLSLPLTTNDQNLIYYQHIVLRNVFWLEFFFYAFVSLVYYDISNNHFKLPKIVSRKRAFGLFILSGSILFVSFSVADANVGPNILYYELIKLAVTLAIPMFYFGYKNQSNYSSKSLLSEFNPAFKLFYTKVMNDLRSDDKSYGIAKKFLKIHREDIRNSLVNSTPVNFKDNIRSVIVNDYERLETLFAYNDLNVKSKVAVIDFCMEVFSTFLINVEVNLQEIYTEHLLKSDHDNLKNVVGSDFIESKFSKLFSQWESLDFSS